MSVRLTARKHVVEREAETIVRRGAAQGKKKQLCEFGMRTVWPGRRERMKGEREEQRRRTGGRITREIQKREGNGLYQAARWSTFRFFYPSWLFSSFFYRLFPLIPRFPLCPSGPSLIVFHSFLCPFHFVTVRVSDRPCETFAVPHGWAG